MSIRIAGVLLFGGMLMAAGAMPSRLSGQPDSPKKITLSEISSRGVEGRLGRQLGTVVELRGEVVANTSLAKADVDERFFLRIDKVDGINVATPILIAERDMRGAVPGSARIGDHFHCAGYETGGFNGVVNQANEVPFDGPSFGFGTSFVVTKMIGDPVQK